MRVAANDREPCRLDADDSQAVPPVRSRRGRPSIHDAAPSDADDIYRLLRGCTRGVRVVDGVRTQCGRCSPLGHEAEYVAGMGDRSVDGLHVV
ncbi:hypothetical protein, partial [Streptomyces broussonetiae]|uniref:hypothetical protein n=1 Tax=Streptomyces broussonetiae TaxID=2686304 RepID=UPI0035D8CE79